MFFTNLQQQTVRAVLSLSLSLSKDFFRKESFVAVHGKNEAIPIAFTFIARLIYYNDFLSGSSGRLTATKEINYLSFQM